MLEYNWGEGGEKGGGERGGRGGEKGGEGQMGRRGEGREAERKEEEEVVMTILHESGRVGKAGFECSTTSEIFQFLIPVENLVQQFEKPHFYPDYM